MEIVNGYPCRDCADVARAERGIDPARPEQGPAPKPAGQEPGWVAGARAAGVPERLLDLYA
ncbi:hypothetical protein G3576_14830 [Roseomonas stagni]|uniref:Uncharacterized protein n=1 Tax=Falsiroseomonas algicola TaxID=2716930 RepID=A0A6M1LLT8_9PROT|nr:hypothetical protein [Falsiroseomonas algicola]NGM21296.1 hypothetical protein [Falsiroseomonas algicola]